MKYQNVYERYYFKLLVVFSATFIVCSAVFSCQNGKNQCLMSGWGQWSNCSSSCGGGTSLRFKQICCNRSYTRIEKCAADCNVLTTDYVENITCGQTCVNGVFRQNSCQCPNSFTGKCCESEKATIPVATNRSTASSSKNEITNVCEQGCKFGECKNCSYSCMALFKENVQQAEPWFLVVTTVLGAILMTMIACCVCRFCCGYGKKVEPKENDTRVK